MPDSQLEREMAARNAGQTIAARVKWILPRLLGKERDRSYKRRKRGWGRDIDGGKAAGKCFESATPEDC